MFNCGGMALPGIERVGTPNSLHQPGAFLWGESWRVCTEGEGDDLSGGSRPAFDDVDTGALLTTLDPRDSRLRGCHFLRELALRHPGLLASRSQFDRDNVGVHHPDDTGCSMEWQVPGQVAEIEKRRSLLVERRWHERQESNLLATVLETGPPPWLARGSIIGWGPSIRARL